jgi:hypothetical protein
VSLEFCFSILWSLNELKLLELSLDSVFVFKTPNRKRSHFQGEEASKQLVKKNLGSLNKGHAANPFTTIQFHSFTTL